MIDIDGMSEGTKDKLLLTLRLAALHMPLDHVPALPFDADDLFIYGDDWRAMTGLHPLDELACRAQVLFLTHPDHMLPEVCRVFGDTVNVVRL